MKNELTCLLERRKQLIADLRRSPTATNYEGKRVRNEPNLYLTELNRKIESLRKRS